MCNDAFGYGWDDGGSQQILYRDTNYHIHELRGVAGKKTWTHTDLTKVTGGPPSECLANGYAWKTGKSEQAVYSTDDGHIHELYRGVGGNWKHADLTDIAKAPSSGGAPALINGYAWEGGKSKQVVFWHYASKHIYELYVVAGQAWTWADLTKIAGPNTPPVSNLSYVVNGYAWEGGHCKQVVFWDLSGQIHELYTTGGPWAYANLTQMAKAPLATSVINGYAWEAGHAKQVVYVGPKGHIYELYTVGGPWSYADLTAITSAPAAEVVNNGYAFEAGKSKHVVYQSKSGRIYELSVKVGGSWGYQEATSKFPMSGSDIVPRPATHNGYAWEGGKSRQIVYSYSLDGHLHELVQTLGTQSWSTFDRSKQAGL